jgi:hypothetical protein
MKVMCDFFFKGLRVDTNYYIKQFKSIGVKNRFILDRDDLEKIATKLPTPRYKSALVVDRAKSILEGSVNVETN